MILQEQAIMAPYYAPSNDPVKYRYNPWAVTSTTSQQQTSVPTTADNAFPRIPVQGGSGHRRVHSEASTNSPKQLQQQYLGDAFAGLASYTSPSPSGSSYSSGDGKTWSDIQSVSWASPDLGLNGSSMPGLHSRSSIDTTMMPTSEALGISNPCISLSDVQQFVEPETDANYKLTNDYFAWTDSTNYSTPQINVAQAEQFAPFHSLADIFGSSDATFMQRQHSCHSDHTFTSSSSRDKTQGHRKHSQSVSSPRFSASRVEKRSVPNPRRLSAPVGNSGSSSPARSSKAAAQATASFPCPLATYGCTSCFGSKNEWKRHVNTQHIRLDMWRCDQCNDRDTRPNDFNRKDLFIQHLRRMHHRPSEEEPRGRKPSKGCRRSIGVDDMDPVLVDAEQRCHIRLRQPPAHSTCLFCPAQFQGHGSWEERLEHIGRHLEQDKKDGNDPPALMEWRHDPIVEAWLESEGLISRVGYEWQIADGRKQSR